MYYKTTHQSPLGILTLACTENALVGLWTEEQKYFGDTLLENTTENPNIPIFDKTKKWLDDYFAGKNPAISELPLAPIGSEFRQEVWKILCRIPYGGTITYGAIAKQIAEKIGKETMSSQAVGGAVGHNPISIIIPCHRVIGANGNLTGYAGGIKTKIKLLKIEGVDMSKMFVPKKGTAL